MTELILRGRIVTGSTSIDDGVITVRGDRVSTVEAASASDALQGPGRDTSSSPSVLLPGLVDLHCHGAAGADFSEGSADGARAAARFLHSSGTTTLLASLVSASSGDLLRNVKALRPLAEEGVVAGLHLEGPFLSPHYNGAHDPAFLRNPDPVLVDRLVEAAGGTLTSLTCAAELPGAMELVDQLAAHGVVPSLGHTEADTPEAAEFLERAERGLASLGDGRQGLSRRRPTVTHLFNGMPPMHHRSPGPVAASLREAAAGTVVVELIADGVHLAADTVRMVFDLVGAGNIALVTDSMAAAGLHDGHYRLGGLAVTVRGGVATLDSTGAIAGGTATLLDVVRHTVGAGVPLQEAVRAATAVPASVLGRSDDVGDLRPGMLADVLVLDSDLNLRGVLRHGQWVNPMPPETGRSDAGAASAADA